jgi:hypothetical protein
MPPKKVNFLPFPFTPPHREWEKCSFSAPGEYYALAKIASMFFLILASCHNDGAAIETLQLVTVGLGVQSLRCKPESQFSDAMNYSRDIIALRMLNY